jgi:predicted DNA-binding transcriptional regulator AlpA
MNGEQKLVNLKELSRIVGRSESSLRYHIRKGRIQPSAKFGRSPSFDSEEVMRQLKRGLKVQK